MENQLLINQILQNYQSAQVHSASWRTQAKEDYDFFAGHQYADADRAYLESQRRPVITFNRVGPIIDAVIGMELQNRQQICLSPRDQHDGVTADLLTRAIQWVREQSDAEDEESEAFSDVLICGMGWITTRLDYAQDPTGQVMIDRVDPFEMYWDPQSQKGNLNDANWIMRVKEIDAQQLIALWPDKAADILDRGKDKVKVIEYQWRAKETAPYNHFVYKQAFLCGQTLLSVQDCPYKDGFTYMAITGKRDRNQQCWFGLVRSMKDPQRWANKWLSQILHIINANAKGGLLAERGAFANPRRAEEEWADPTSITILNDGGLNKVQPKPTAPFPLGLDKLMEFAVGSIRDVAGVNVELLGLTNQYQAGVVEYQRKQAGISLLSGFFNALRRYRKQQGRVLLHFIQTYLADGRLMRLDSEKGPLYVPLLKPNNQIAYDVIVDQAPSSPNQKEQVKDVLLQLLPTLMQAGVSLPPDVLDYLPLPQSLVQAWKEGLQRHSKQ